jgi:WD40 repeat protein/serine/threonine protein kinase
VEPVSGTLVKGYELRDRIGAGGFGAVYRAFQSTVGREVAIKIILPGFANRPEFVRRFETEAQVVARLEHMNITPLYDFWRDPEGAYLVMRYLRGGNLLTALRDDPYDLESATRLLDQVASALAVAHRNHVIHRDIKPANILLDEDGNGYIADFGLAKCLDNDATAYSQAGDVMGTPDYLSPEQVRNEPVTPRSDIYSLGVVLYEMLTGSHPFPDSLPVERMFKHLDEPVPRIASLDKNIADAINDVVQKATAKNPDHRYKDVLTMATAFREAAGLSVSQAAGQLVELLTPREQEVLKLIIEGESNREIANKLTIELTTVKWYVTQIYRKLNVRSRVQAIVRARELDLIVDGRAVDDHATSRISTLPEPENPYKGLQAFQIADERDFFGREKLTRKLLSRLGQNGDFSRFLAVIGPSGSGKSSLVRAGLIPALWRGEFPGSEHWYITDFIPGPHPLDELEVALIQVAANRPEHLHEQLARDERGLVRAAQIILPDDDSELVLVIDQFEEIFTLVENESDRTHFLGLLQQAVTAPRSRVRVIITLRADFYDRPLQYPTFGGLVRSRMETVLPLNAGELEQAITGPAQRVGVRFEDGLVASIVSDINYQPGALPLLQFALTELFEARENRILTHQGYDQIGRATGALAKRAEQLCLELDHAGQEAVRQMFLRLITLGEGVDDTRRRVVRSELLAIAQDADLMDEVIDTYAAYRLLALDHDPITRRPTVEVAHEALIREWDRLRQWLNESRADIRLQRLLAVAAAEWLRADRDLGFLLYGSRLDQFEGWATNTDLALTEKERAYLEASLTARQKREADEAARLQRELETAQKLAKTEQYAARRLRWLAVGLAVFLLAAAGLAIFAFNRQAEAQTNLALSESQRLAAEANNILQSGGDPELAALLSLRALDTVYTTQADIALQQASKGDYGRRLFSGHTDSVDGLAFSPDGRFALSGSLDNTARLWDVETGREIHTLTGHTGWIRNVAYSPDGNYLLTGSTDNTARLWDAQTGQELYTLTGHTGEVYGVAFSPDGQYAITGGWEGTIRFWDVETGQEARSLRGDEGIFEMTLSPDGQYILTGNNATGKVRVSETATGLEAHHLTGLNTSGINTVAFSPDGRYALAGDEIGGLYLWDLQQAEAEPRIFSGHTEWINEVRVSPDGKYALSASHDGTARLWDIQTGEEARRFISTNHVTSIAFSPDGQTVLVGEQDGNIKLWDVEPLPDPRTFGGHTNVVSAAKFSPNGRYVLTGSLDQTAKLWNVVTGQQLYVLRGHSGEVWGVAFSPDSRYALTGSSDKTARLWDVETGQEERVFTHPDEVSGVAFSPDGRYVLTASWDNTARLWDVETGQEVRVFTGHTDFVAGVAFSPDGRYILTGSFGDVTTRLWEVETGREVRQFPGYTDFVNGLSFSPDGKYIITADEGTTGQLWEVETGQPLDRFPGDVGRFSADGKFLLTGGLKTAHLWDRATGEQLRTFSVANNLWSVELSPDGKLILIGGSTQTAELWDTDYQTLVDSVCARVLRDFTDEEREEYNINDQQPTCPSDN